MTPETMALLADAMSRGVRLRWLGGDRVHADAPRGVLTPELVEALRAVKPEILAACRPQTRVVACVCCGRFAYVEPTMCYWCRQSHRPPEGDG